MPLGLGWWRVALVIRSMIPCGGLVLFVVCAFDLICGIKVIVGVCVVIWCRK